MVMDELLDLDNPNLTHFTTQRRSFPFLSCTMDICIKIAQIVSINKKIMDGARTAATLHRLSCLLMSTDF